MHIFPILGQWWFPRKYPSQSAMSHFIPLVIERDLYHIRQRRLLIVHICREQNVTVDMTFA